MADNNSQIPGTLFSNTPTTQLHSNTSTTQLTNTAPIALVNFNEEQARKAVRSQLEQSVASFIAAHPIQRLSPADAALITWVADQGKEAQKNLAYFWDHLTEYGYTSEHMEYIDIYQQVVGKLRKTPDIITNINLTR